MPSMSHKDGFEDALAESPQLPPASLGFPCSSYKGLGSGCLFPLSLESFTQGKKGRGNWAAADMVLIGAKDSIY